MRYLFRDAGGASEQIDLPLAARCELEQRHQEIGSGNPFGQRTSEQASDPYERHPICERQARISIRTTERLVLVGLHNVVDVGCEDGPPLPAIDQCFDFVQRLSKREGVDPNRANSNTSTWADGSQWFGQALRAGILAARVTTLYY